MPFLKFFVSVDEKNGCRTSNNQIALNTEAVACECEGTGVDVEVITLGTTLTPSLLSNLPGGPQGEAVMKIALTPEECVDEAFEKLGKELSVIAGQRNKDSVHDWKANHTEDEYIRYMGSFYRD
ncbi:hypothetical protein [Collinsella sp. HCP3S3_E5]|uniref:hypothetical protein n=1 Tax=Collinsella sp. HCP3S3_E5 TaxID=3438936 RepID=UPI003F8CEE8B